MVLFCEAAAAPPALHALNQGSPLPVEATWTGGICYRSDNGAPDRRCRGVDPLRVAAIR